MSEKSYTAEEVFGIGRDRPLNYVQRKNVDVPFFESLSRGKHIVIYGSSKQGKTSLRKEWLTDHDHLTISCLSSMTLPQLHAAILKRAGYRLEQTTSKSTDGTWKYSAEFKGKGGLPFIAEASGGGSISREDKSVGQTTTKPIELDMGDVNDIIVALNEGNAPTHIVLEDFHYLPMETQTQFSIALKAFHESSPYVFVVIGVWREKNRLIYFNGDLTSRVVAIDADEWTNSELEDVVRAGQPLLNVSFDDTFVKDLISNSHNAVYLVQEGCLKACQQAGVFRTGDDLTNVGSGLDASKLIKAIVDEQAGRYTAFLNNVSEGFQRSGLEMYRWLLVAILQTPVDDLQGGLRRAKIAARIKDYHPQGAGLNEGNITQALTSIASLQVNKGIRPIIIDYDQTHKMLNIVDRAFLVWLSYQDTDELTLEIMGNGIWPEISG